MGIWGRQLRQRPAGQRHAQGRIDPPPRALETKDSIELATLEWVPWFNHYRLLEPIGYIPPADAEENYYRQLVSQPVTPV